MEKIVAFCNASLSRNYQKNPLKDRCFLVKKSYFPTNCSVSYSNTSSTISMAHNFCGSVLARQQLQFKAVNNSCDNVAVQISITTTKITPSIKKSNKIKAFSETPD